MSDLRRIKILLGMVVLNQVLSVPKEVLTQAGLIELTNWEDMIERSSNIEWLSLYQGDQMRLRRRTLCS
jgi:hypothetical protein